MLFKTILIAINAAREGDADLLRAADIAAGLDAHLHVLALGLAPPPPSTPYGIVANDVWAGEIREGQEDVETRAQAMLALMRERGVRASADAHYVDRGTVTTLAGRAARYADLTLVVPEGAGGDAMQTWVMDGALFESGRPLLLLPEGVTTFPNPERVMIAWDASVEASKAVRDALGLMKAAKEVHAVLIDPVPSFDGHGAEPGADLATYLGRHGISLTVHRLPREGRKVSEIINRTASDLDAGLIVMGGFGHSRLRQRIFGGTTTSMIQAARVPVLMAH
jgi:nucleotide-binding universal stress UspA family protein